MKRKIYSQLLEWKQNRKGTTALLIEGARRVGKSYIVEQFARQEYKTYILIDFNIAGDDIRQLFDNYLGNLNTLFMYLTNYTGVKLYERQSLIIFDEVQFFPRARAAIKYLVADGRYDYIETGSLVSIKQSVAGIMLPSEEETLEMFPMDFEEFLWASDNDILMDFIRDRFNNKQPLGNSMHRKAMDYFRQYMIVGGMPQAVEKYIVTKDFQETDRVKRQILTLYRHSAAQYAGGYADKVVSLFDEIPSQLQRHEKRFRLSDLKKDARLRDYESSFFWLSDAKIVNICYNTTEPSVGLNMKKDRVTLKCYMADTGLLISHAFDEKGIVSNEVYQKILKDKLEFNSGMIIENIVAQMLRTSGHKLYFYSNPSVDDKDDRMEIDFLIQKSKITSRHNIIPLEVKSNQRYTLVSLKKCIEKYGSYITSPCVIHAADLKEENGILYVPLYMTGLL
ncbi:MAG: ATP-binding protein [Bacteroidales bacterium]|nr:ATP-binding protein [Bacteroidales bacterium]